MSLTGSYEGGSKEVQDLGRIEQWLVAEPSVDLLEEGKETGGREIWDIIQEHVRMTRLLSAHLDPKLPNSKGLAAKWVCRQGNLAIC